MGEKMLPSQTLPDFQQWKSGVRLATLQFYLTLLIHDRDFLKFAFLGVRDPLI
jgi:hypothetical protein